MPEDITPVQRPVRAGHPGIGDVAAAVVPSRDLWQAVADDLDALWGSR